MNLARFGFAAALTAMTATAALADPAYVATTAIVEHPALDAVRDGVRDELAEQGYTGDDKLKFTYESAQGQPAIAAQIARRIVGETPDVIVAIATPSAQATVAATKEIPVVFSAVTDPVGAKLVASMDNPGGNVTGISDMLPLDEHLGLIREILPEAKTLGVPYNPGEANAVSSVKMLEEAAPKHGFTIVTAAATKSSEVLGATQTLVGKADALYALTDNTIVTAMESVVKVGLDNQIPVFAADTGSVERGAVAAVGFDYYDLGRQTGEVVVQILEGTDPGTIPVQIGKASKLFVNPKMAERMGITLPQAVVDRATKVVE